jgi:hypothetical protein
LYAQEEAGDQSGEQQIDTIYEAVTPEWEEESFEADTAQTNINRAISFTKYGSGKQSDTGTTTQTMLSDNQDGHGHGHGGHEQLHPGRWVMLVDDRTFVQTSHLQDLVASLNPQIPAVYGDMSCNENESSGQQGEVHSGIQHPSSSSSSSSSTSTSGKGSLGLCMGGGALFSPAMLQRMAQRPSFQKDLIDQFFNHESTTADTRRRSNHALSHNSKLSTRSRNSSSGSSSGSSDDSIEDDRVGVVIPFARMLSRAIRNDQQDQDQNQDPSMVSRMVSHPGFHSKPPSHYHLDYDADKRNSKKGDGASYATTSRSTLFISGGGGRRGGSSSGSSATPITFHVERNPSDVTSNAATVKHANSATGSNIMRDRMTTGDGDGDNDGDAARRGGEGQHFLFKLFYREHFENLQRKKQQQLQQQQRKKKKQKHHQHVRHQKDMGPEAVAAAKVAAAEASVEAKARAGVVAASLAVAGDSDDVDGADGGDGDGGGGRQAAVLTGALNDVINTALRNGGDSEEGSDGDEGSSGILQVLKMLRAQMSVIEAAATSSPTAAPTTRHSRNQALLQAWREISEEEKDIYRRQARKEKEAKGQKQKSGNEGREVSKRATSSPTAAPTLTPTSRHSHWHKYHRAATSKTDSSRSRLRGAVGESKSHLRQHHSPAFLTSTPVQVDAAFQPTLATFAKASLTDTSLANKVIKEAEDEIESVAQAVSTEAISIVEKEQRAFARSTKAEERRVAERAGKLFRVTKQVETRVMQTIQVEMKTLHHMAAMPPTMSSAQVIPAAWFKHLALLGSMSAGASLLIFWCWFSCFSCISWASSRDGGNARGTVRQLAQANAQKRLAKRLMRKSSSLGSDDGDGDEGRRSGSGASLGFFSSQPLQSLRESETPFLGLKGRIALEV